MKDVKCPKCDTIFGKQRGDTLTIKHRDLYRYIEGKVYGPCRGCGATVEWPQTLQDNQR